MPNQSRSIESSFAALSDPTRLAVIARLCAGPATVSDLALPFDMALPSFVQHLRVLERSGLVDSTKQGRVRTYRLAPSRLMLAENWLLRQRSVWERRLDQLDDYLMQLKEKE